MSQNNCVLERQFIAAHRESFGSTSATVINQLNNLAVVLIAQGELTQAAETQEAAVADARVVLGSEHPNTGVYVHTLGEIHTRLRQATA